jgi:hypothetical protein
VDEETIQDDAFDHVDDHADQDEPPKERAGAGA